MSGVRRHAERVQVDDREAGNLRLARLPGEFAEAGRELDLLCHQNRADLGFRSAIRTRPRQGLFEYHRLGARRQPDGLRQGRGRPAEGAAAIAKRARRQRP